MKRAYSAVKETIARYVRWFIASIATFIVLLPVIATLSLSE